MNLMNMKAKQSGKTMHRYLSSFMFAFIVYALTATLAIAAFLNFHEDSKKIKIINIDKVCLTMVVQKPQTAQIEETPKQSEAIVQEKPKIDARIKPKPIVKKPEPKPVVKKEEIEQKPINEPLQEQHVQESIKETPKAEPIKKAQDAKTAPLKPQVDPELLKAKRERFISELINRINQNKSYPNSARRRAIEGEVEVEFAIASNGSVHDIEIISGHDIFKNSAIEAIQNSFPINIEEGLFEFPKKFKISILYILK